MKKNAIASDSKTETDNEVTIVGAGWAGLACASRLCHHGFKVRLFDAAKKPGGRARDIDTPLGRVDNGQHLLIGAYQQILSLITLLGMSPSDVFIRQSLDLRIDSLTGTGLRLRSHKLPAPFGLLLGLLSAEGLTLGEKMTIIRCWRNMQKSHFRLDNDQTVRVYLQTQRQSERLIQLFWAPLCIAALNTSIDQASMQVYMHVLQQSFSHRRGDSDLLFPRCNLGQLLPEPLAAWIQDQGGQIHMQERVQELHIDEQHGMTAITTSHGQYPARHLILATPYEQTLKLLSELPAFEPVCESLAQLQHEPITTLYMQFPHHVQIPGYIRGLSDGLCEWLIDRRSCQQAGLMAAVISANGMHMQMTKAELTDQILAETQQVFPDWPRPIKTFMVREKRATFRCDVHSQAYRPVSGPIGHQVYICGDYTDTKLPATLEAAVQSGLQCAQQLMQSLNVPIKEPICHDTKPPTIS